MRKYRFNTTPLDPELLTRSFEKRTNWCVLTGAACTGKTTLISMLAEKGNRVIPESARRFFEQKLAAGKPLEDICKDGEALQRSIASIQLEYERAIEPGALVFLDRAIPDSLSFFRVHGMDPNEILPECYHHCYASVFVLDRLPLHRDKMLGPEDDTAAMFLDQWLERDYCSLGYEVIRVPVLSPQDRLDFILKNL